MLNYCQIQVVECLFYLDNFPVMSNLNKTVLFNYCKSSKNHNRNLIHLKRIIYCQLSVFAHCLNQHCAHMFQCARMLCVCPNCTLMSLSIFTHSRRHTTAWQTQTRIVVSWMQTVTIRRAGPVSGSEMAMPNGMALVHIVRRMRSANAWIRVWCINMFLCLCNYCSLRQHWWDIVRLSVFITVERSSVWRPSPDVRLWAELIFAVAEWKQSFFLEMFYIVQDYTVFFSSFASPYELRLNLHAYTIESIK